MKRYAKHLNLISEITKLLKEANHPNPDKWLDGLYIYQVREGLCISKIQRVVINQYWSK